MCGFDSKATMHDLFNIHTQWNGQNTQSGLIFKKRKYINHMYV